MRVASRRLRGALRDFAPYLAKRRVASCLKNIKEIAQALGRVRDNDVAIMKLERTAAKAPADVAAGIHRFVQFREADRQTARVQLTPIITRESLSELTTKFRAMLEQAPLARAARSSVRAVTEITYREVGSSIILARLDELEKLSKNLYQPLKIRPLHEMRIAVKHLRYALQLFEQCWGPPIKFFQEKVAELQTSLGKLHDCDVWIKALSEMAGRDGPELDFDHRATAVWLLCHFLKARSKHLSAALVQWQEWETMGFSGRLRESIQAASSVSKTSKEGLSVH